MSLQTEIRSVLFTCNVCERPPRISWLLIRGGMQKEESMNERKLSVDTTYLSLETAEERGFIHRDYIAHCLRWSHVIKCLMQKNYYKDARLLDIGCGRELPLATTLYSSKMQIKKYYGVDYGPINDDALDRFRTGRFTLDVFENTDILNVTTRDLDGEPVDWITCFEMLEHVEPAHMIRVLEHIRTLATSNARIFLSTPCWNMKDCAANHVNEIKYEVLGSILETAGYEIVATHGTFASQSDYVHLMSDTDKSLFDRLRAYYDSNLLSCVFAPLFPAQSRNALWEVAMHRHGERKFPTLGKIPAPWGSSTEWEQIPQNYI